VELAAIASITEELDCGKNEFVIRKAKPGDHVPDY